jgi:hypothetical protein
MVCLKKSSNSLFRISREIGLLFVRRTAELEIDHTGCSPLCSRTPSTLHWVPQGAAVGLTKLKGKTRTTRQHASYSYTKEANGQNARRDWEADANAREGQEGTNKASPAHNETATTPLDSNRLMPPNNGRYHDRILLTAPAARCTARTPSHRMSHTSSQDHCKPATARPRAPRCTGSPAEAARSRRRRTRRRSRTACTRTAAPPAGSPVAVAHSAAAAAAA